MASIYRGVRPKPRRSDSSQPRDWRLQWLQRPRQADKRVIGRNPGPRGLFSIRRSAGNRRSPSLVCRRIELVEIRLDRLVARCTPSRMRRLKADRRHPTPNPLVSREARRRDHSASATAHVRGDVQRSLMRSWPSRILGQSRSWKPVFPSTVGLASLHREATTAIGPRPDSPTSPGH